MTLEAEFFTMAATGGGGVIMGWGLGKLIKIVIKIAAIIAGGLIGLLMYLNMQHVITVDWNRIQVISSGAVNWVTSFIPIDSFHNVAANVGITSTMAVVPGFFFGFIHGIK